MSRILFATWAGGGNVPPALALAGALQSQGHEVIVMGHPQLAEAASGAGANFIGYRRAHHFAPTSAPNPLTLIRVFGDAAMGAEVAAEDCDIAIVDCLLVGVMSALAKHGRPYVVLEHLFDDFLTGPAQSGPIPLGLRLKGIRPRDLLDAAALRLVATLPELDSPTAANASQVGPFVSGCDARPIEPAILLSLSTYPYPGMGRCWQRALDAVGRVDARVIATTGPAVAADSLRPSANTEIHPWLPHAEVMPQVSMVVGHGGHSTTMLALAHGLPLVIMPMFSLADQPMVGRAVQAAGAGRVVRKSSRPGDLADTIADVLTNKGYRTHANELGSRIREMNSLMTAVALIEKLL